MSNCYECDTPLTTICPQCNALSAAPSPAPDEKTVRAFADHIEKLAFSIPPPNPYTPQIVQACVELRAAISALRPAPKLSEEERAALEEIRLICKEQDGYAADNSFQRILSLIDKLTESG